MVCTHRQYRDHVLFDRFRQRRRVVEREFVVCAVAGSCMGHIVHTAAVEVLLDHADCHLEGLPYIALL